MQEKKNTCTEQQYSVISNINDIKIYTCNLTALNILRHFCNSIDLLVLSARGSDNRTLSSERQTEGQRKRKRNGTYLSYSQFFKNGHFMALALSLFIMGLSDTKDPLWRLGPLSQGWFWRRYSKAGCVSFPWWSMFCLWWDVLIWRPPWC